MQKFPQTEIFITKGMDHAPAPKPSKQPISEQIDEAPEPHIL
jgi:hypothetical protein